MNIQALAQRVTRKYGTNDPEIILQTLQIKIFELPMFGIRGIYKRVKRNTIVFVNSELQERERFFVLAHELGHHLLHRGDNRVYLDRCTFYETSRYEKEADLFAVCLMAYDLEEPLDTDMTVDVFASKLGIPRDLAEAYFCEFFGMKF